MSAVPLGEIFFDILQLRVDLYFFRLLIFYIDTETLMLSVLSFRSPFEQEYITAM